MHSLIERPHLMLHQIFPFWSQSNHLLVAVCSAAALIAVQRALLEAILWAIFLPQQGIVSMFFLNTFCNQTMVRCQYGRSRALVCNANKVAVSQRVSVVIFEPSAVRFL